MLMMIGHDSEQRTDGGKRVEMEQGERERERGREKTRRGNFVLSVTGNVIKNKTS